jgi:hypothetical protein
MNNILKKVTDGDIVDGYYTIPDGVEIIYLASFLSVFSSFPEGVEQVWHKE